MTNLSIIIPCRNEEFGIKKTISTINKKLKNKIIYEIIIINDFSTDKTLDVIKKISIKNKKINFFNNRNKGLGGAINLGINKSKSKFIVIVMSDLSDSPEDILNYYNIIKTNKYDAIFGSRFLKKSKIIDYPVKKLILNRVFNIFVKLIFNSDYNDFTNAFKIYKKSALKNIRPLISESFNIFLEIPLKIITRNYKYKIIPINWKNRKLGLEKFKIQELGSKYLFTLLYIIFEKVLLKKTNKN